MESLIDETMYDLMSSKATLPPDILEGIITPTYVAVVALNGRFEDRSLERLELQFHSGAGYNTGMNRGFATVTRSYEVSCKCYNIYRSKI